jgi:hypothetical protein
VINTTAGKLKVAEDAIARLTQASLPAKAAYHICKLARLASQEMKFFEEQRVKLVQELGTVHENGTTTVDDPEKLKAFQDKYTELTELNVEIDWFPITISMLETVQITPGDLMALGPLLEDVPGPESEPIELKGE